MNARRTRAALTVAAALLVAGGLVRLCLDTEAVQVALPDRDRAEDEATRSAAPLPMPHVEAALARPLVVRDTP